MAPIPSLRTQHGRHAPHLVRRLLSLPLIGFSLVSAAFCQGETVVPPQQWWGTGNFPPEKVIEGTHLRMTFDRDVERVAIGAEGTLKSMQINSREFLLLGEGTGRTSVIIWFADGTVEERSYAVVPDLSMLQMALMEIHPTVSAEMAPDREAIVLRGLVPNESYRQAIEAAARSYLEAGSSVGDKNVEPLVAGADAEGNRQVRADSSNEIERSGSVINLIQVEELPRLLEELMLDAISEVSPNTVTIKRLVRGGMPDDDEDVFLLDGTLPDQTSLVRVLNVSARVLLGSSAEPNNIRVVADEAGALADPIGGAVPGIAGGSSGSGTVNFSSAGDTVFGGGQSSKGLFNRIGSNIARAKVLEAAGGRILCFIKVDDLPQVRVNIELYEINRSKLRSQRADLALIFGSFDQPGLIPGPVPTTIQGDNAASVGADGSAVQDALGFLEDGFSNQFQVSGSHVALDTFFQFLESEGIARALSRPSLTVLSGEMAQFQVGGEVPIQSSFSPALGTGEATNSGVFNTTVFKPFGVQLAIRPLVDEDNRITLDVIPQIVVPDAQLTVEIRESTGGEVSSVGFESRSMRTSARLRDGETLVVGGLISKRQRDASSYAPGLNKIPIIGRFFERYQTDDEDMELVFVVNPVVIRDTLPTAGLWAFPTARELLRSTTRPRAGASRAAQAQ